MNNRTKTLNYIIIIILVALLGYSFMSFKNQAPKTITMSDLTKDINDKKIEKIIVNGNEITANIIGGGQEKTFKELGVGLNQYGITTDKVAIEINNPDKNSMWWNLATIFLPFVLVALFLWLIMRQAQGNNTKALSFGKSNAKMFSPTDKKTTFKDVAGAEEPKQELMEIVEFLKNTGKFKAIGAEIPKGVLLFGPPGTGKTLLARAVAGEAGVPFFTISASEFVEMFVGVGASRVRDMFEKAKRNAPCICFIDELDAVGRQRGTGLGGSHDEREQTLNQILVEMDGFEANSGVVVMAATNRPDVLDPALLRPGRFDRRVMLDLPNLNDRLEILKIHSKNKPMEKNTNLKTVSRSTAGFSGADLKNVMNEAAILAARQAHKEIHQSDLHEAMEKVMMGPEKKSQVLSQEEKKITAYHEGGHAIVASRLEKSDPVHKVSVVSRGMALGYTWTLPTEDKHLYSKSKFNDEISQLLGGWASEKIIFGETTTGAQNDLKRASRLARDMVTVYGMSDKLGPIAFSEREELVFLGKELGEHKVLSEKVAADIDAEVAKILDDNKIRTLEILNKNKSVLEELATKLLESETIEGEELDKLLGVKKQEEKKDEI